MRIDECRLDPDLAVSAPFERSEPEPSWLDARLQMPASLYRFYELSRYLSFSALAGSSTAHERLVSAYFARITRSLKDMLLEAADLGSEIPNYLRSTYTPVKKIRGETWDREAPRKERAAFRLLVINLTGVLDSLADLTGILLPGVVPSLQVGRSSFNPVARWLRHDIQSTAVVVTAVDHFGEELYRALRPVVHVSSGPEEDWLSLLQLFRNKAAHLGHHAWHHVVLHSSEGEFGYFLPREWPFVPEEQVEPAQNNPAQPADVGLYLREHLVHVDIPGYIQGALHKITQVVETSFTVFCEAFVSIGALPRVEIAAAAIRKSSERLNFTHFVSAG